MLKPTLIATSLLAAAPALATPMHASWYGAGENACGGPCRAGKRTASGQPFNPNGHSAAHRTLPFGTRLLVTYKGRSIVVVVNDRGPAAWTGRSLDLSRGAARSLGMGGTGVVDARIIL